MNKTTWKTVERRVAEDDLGKFDYQTKAIDLSVKHGMLRLPERVGPRKRGDLIMTSHAEGQLAGRIAVPVGYYRKVRDTDPDLADRMLNHGIAQFAARNAQGRKADKQELLIRGRNDVCRGVLSDVYSVVDNKDVVEVVHDLTQGQFDHSIRSFHLHDKGFYLKVTSDDLAVPDPTARNNDLKVGFIVGNSEVGTRDLFSFPFVYRAFCTNDMVIEWSKAMRRRHAHLTKDALKLQLTQSLAHALRTGDQLLAQLLALREERIEKPVDVIKSLVKQAKYSKRIEDEAVLAFDEEPEKNRWGVVNAFTRAAQKESEMDDRVAIEIWAGGLVQDVKAWQRATAN